MINTELPSSPARNTIIYATLYRSSCKSKKSKQTEELDTAIASVEELLSKPREEEDKVGLFGRSVAAKMRTFNRYKIALAQRQIECILFDIEY